MSLVDTAAATAALHAYRDTSRSEFIARDFTRLIVQGRPETEEFRGRMGAALREHASRLGYRYASSMEDHLSASDLVPRVLPTGMELPMYHLIEVPPENLFAVIAGLYHQFGNPDRPDYIEILEPDFTLEVLAPPTKIGTNFSLTAGNSSHRTYLADLNVPAARRRKVDGTGTRIAVIDTGLEPGNSLARFHDLTGNAAAVQDDKNGHGTAMVKIIRAVCPGADIFSIRVTDSSYVFVWDLMAGVIAAVYKLDAHIVSLSMGCKHLNQPCPVCLGQLGARSIVCERLFDLIHENSRLGRPDPIFVAATGNDGQSQEFDWPARHTSVLAVGSVTHGKQVSSFSNNATIKSAHVRCLCPGGEIDSANNITEYVGEGNDAGQTVQCVGTSPATAYAAGVLGLLRHYLAQSGGRTDSLSLLSAAKARARTDVANYDVNAHGMGRLVFGP